MNNDPLIVITGPTATGKTKLAVALANKTGGEIISADSRQVYRSMDIGTGKDIDTYDLGSAKIPYHLIDICEPGDRYTINRYYKDFTKTFALIRKRGNPAILCGGSGLYLETALVGNSYAAVPVNQAIRKRFGDWPINKLKALAITDPALPFEVDCTSKKRMIRALEIKAYMKRHSIESRQGVGEYHIFVLCMNREDLKKRITQRLYSRVKQGMIGEVETLLATGVSADNLKYYGLEYKWITSYLLGEIDKAMMLDRLKTAIHRFAKRQMTWFRRMERKGYKLLWIDADKAASSQLDFILETLGSIGKPE